MDPGLETTGYGVISCSRGRPELLEAGTVRSRRTDPLPRRLLELYEGFLPVLDAFRPSLMGLEELFSHHDHPAPAIAMGHARGVLCLAAASRGVEVVSLPPASVKRSVTGNGRASKQQVADMTRHLLGIGAEVRPRDVTDALAIALALCRGA